jgi:hypothetical protein
MQEVSGSIPLFSTRLERHHTLCGAFFVLHSSHENTQKISVHCRSLRETGCFVREWQTTEGGTCAIIE